MFCLPGTGQCPWVTTTNCARFVDSVVERITRYLDGDVSHIANPEALAAR